MKKPLTAAEWAATPPPLAGRDSRPIPERPGYRACDAGYIWSSRRRCGSALTDDLDAFRPIRPRKDPGGYLLIRVVCPEDRTTRTYRVHRLILEAFAGPRPPGLQARHLDGDKRNNKPSNLAWGTPKENGQDRVKHGTHVRGNAIVGSKLTEADIQKILELRVARVPLLAIAHRFQVGINTIKRIIYGKTWLHVARTTPIEIGLRGRAKLKEQDIRKIRELHSAGVPPNAIALRFQVTPTTINRIVRGLGWRHISD